jgi:hypothetical protein
MPTATDLVTDLPADFETFGQAVATSMADLLGGTTGQVLSKASNTDMDFTWVAQDDSNAIQNAIVDAKGDLIAATAADTPARLAVGANDTVLTADSTTATGLKWATPSSGGMTLLASGSISGASVDLTSISQSYTNLVVQYSGVNWNTSDDYLIMRFNGNTANEYSTFLQGTKLNASLFYGAIDSGRILIYPGQNWLRTGDNMFTFTIPDYAATTLDRHLMYGTVEGTPIDGTGYKVLGTFAGATYNTAAISRITLSTQTGLTFNGGTYKLWGVK